MLGSQTPSPIIVRTAYRPDIDGLRAIAVLSVLAYHYGAAFPWPLLPGGFTGVDVFFVISGFLITSRLAGDITVGQFSILGFYDSRVRRILPALIVMLVVTLLAGKFLLTPGDYNILATSTATAAFGVSNFFFLANTGYFDQTADLMPLIHTWSLAVEEQFYAVWPLLLFVISVSRKRLNVTAILGALVIVGFAVSLAWFDSHPKAAFFMAAPRAWELALGALLVYLPPLRRAMGEIAAALGLALIGVGFVTVTAASFPGAAALYPCVGAALVIWPRRDTTAGGAWLGCLSPIGLISYSLYLWHWPVWVMFRIYSNNGTPRIREALALALVSIVFAVLSYRFIESPVRGLRWRPARFVWAGALACIAVSSGAIYVRNVDGLPARLPPSVYAMRSRDVMWKWDCPEQVTLGKKTYCGFGASWSSSRKGILWGDSHAAHLVPIIDAIAKQRAISFILLGACPAALGGDIHRRWPENPDYQATCRDERKNALELLNGTDIDFIVLASAWTTLSTLDLYADDGNTASTNVELIRSGLTNILPLLKREGRKVILVTDMAGPGTNMTECILARESTLLGHLNCTDDDLIIRSKERRGVLGPLTDMVSSFASTGVTIVRPIDTMCGDVECITHVNGEFIWMDYSHIRRNLSAPTDRQIGHILGLDDIIR